MNRHHDPDASARGLRYTLPAAAGTIWLGLGWISLAGLAVTVTAVVGLLMQGLPLPLVVPLAAAGAAVSAVPVAGRPALAWVPTLTGHHLARCTGASNWSRPFPEPRTASSAPRVDRVKLGIGPRRLDLLVATGTSGTGATEIPQVTAIAHGHPGRVTQPGRRGRSGSGRVTVVFELVALGRFGVLDPPEQDTELARWGTSLAVLCADPIVHSVQWLTHARPDTRSHTPAGPRAAALTSASAMLEDNAALADAITQQATRHRHLLALTIDTPGHGPSSAERREGGSTPDSLDSRDVADANVTEALAGIARDTATALLAADLLARPLAAADLGTTLRLLLDPALVETAESSRVGSFSIPACDSESGLLQDRRQWLPVSVRSGWDSCRTDDTHHRCFAITGWPRQALPGDWLAPLLHDTPPAGTSRTLTVHARPVRPEHAARRARAASAKAHLDASDRSRLGFTPHPGGSVNDGLAEADAAATEAELAAGYRMTDTSALLTISATDPQQLEAACRQLRAVAVAHRLDLRPLHGQHLTALAAALPLGLHAGATS